MKIVIEERGYAIKDASSNDIRALRRMILSACLLERRDFNNLKNQIDELEKNGLLDK